MFTVLELEEQAPDDPEWSRQLSVFEVELFGRSVAEIFTSHIDWDVRVLSVEEHIADDDFRFIRLSVYEHMPRVKVVNRRQ